eukprot:16440063-Heterocapsa_arctica.AAC.1
MAATDKGKAEQKLGNATSDGSRKHMDGKDTRKKLPCLYHASGRCYKQSAIGRMQSAQERPSLLALAATFPGGAGIKSRPRLHVTSLNNPESAPLALIVRTVMTWFSTRRNRIRPHAKLWLLRIRRRRSRVSRIR